MRAKSGRTRAIVGLWVMAVGGLLLALVPVVPAAAATLTVNTLNDVVADDGLCSLREAITAANSDTASGASAGECPAGSGADTITFAVDGTFAGSTVPFTITTAVTVDGDGVGTTVIGGQINVLTGASATVQDLSVQVSAGNAINVTSSAGTTSVTVSNVSVNERLNLNSGSGGTTTATVNDLSVSAGGVNVNSGSGSTTTATFTDIAVVHGMNFNSGGTPTSTTTGTVTGASVTGDVVNTNGAGTNVTISDSTVSGNSFGTGINQNGAGLTLTNVTVTGNSGTGVLVASGATSFSMTRSTVTGNGDEGISICCSPTTTATVTDSTISDNGDGEDGGVDICGEVSVSITRSVIDGNNGPGVATCSLSTLEMTNTTVSGNSANGLENDGSASLLNVTIAGNGSTTSDHGIENFGDITLKNTIVTGSSGTECETSSGTITSGGHNIAQDATCNLTAGGDQPSVSDPQLGALADNGGPTRTHLPAAGSPAVDAGTNTGCPATDQRGVTRPQDGDGDSTAVCDIGAVEVSEGGAPPPTTPPPSGSGDLLLAKTTSGTGTPPGSGPTGPDCSATTFDGFSGASGLTLNGDAAVVGDVLRVTPSATGQAGSAFTTDAISLASDASFSTYFQFQFTQPLNGGADGLVFVVQTNSNSVGGSGGGIGYAGIDNSVGVEFDNWNNGSGDGNSANHVGINLDGSTASDPLATWTPEFDQGAVHHAWVDYDGATDALEVRLSTSSTRPDAALLTKTVDLVTVLGSTDAFVGFTSGTGAAGANHDVLFWTFNNCFAPVGEAATYTFSVACDGVDPETVSIAAGEDPVIAVPDVAAGTECTITETDAQGADATSYTTDPTASEVSEDGTNRAVTITIPNPGADVTVTADNVFDDATSPGPAPAPVVAPAAASTGSLMLTKEVVNGAGGETFDFAVACGTTTSVAILGDGGSATFPDIPLGTTCTVTEQDVPDTARETWTAEVVDSDGGNDGVVVVDGPETVVFTNTRTAVEPATVTPPPASPSQPPEATEPAVLPTVVSRALALTGFAPLGLVATGLALIAVGAATLGTARPLRRLDRRTRERS